MGGGGLQVRHEGGAEERGAIGPRLHRSWEGGVWVQDLRGGRCCVYLHWGHVWLSGLGFPPHHFGAGVQVGQEATVGTQLCATTLTPSQKEDVSS